MQYQTGYGGGFLVGKVPLELAVEVTDGAHTVYEEASVWPWPDAGHQNVVLVIDVADDFLDDVFQGHHPHEAAVFVDDQGEVLAALAEGFQLVDQQGLFGDEPGIGGERRDVKAAQVFAAGHQIAQQGLGVKNTDDVVGVVAP